MNRRRDGPAVAGDAGRPGRLAGRIADHAGGGVAPDFVDELGVNLIPVGIRLHAAREGGRISVVHQPQRGTVGQPHAVADVVHPPFAHLGVGRFGAVLLHEHQIEVLDVGIVVREGAVVLLHLRQTLGVSIGEVGLVTLLLDELVLEGQAIHVAHHLAEPCTGNLVAQFVERNALLLRRRRTQCHAGKQRHYNLFLHFLLSVGFNRFIVLRPLINSRGSGSDGGWPQGRSSESGRAAWLRDLPWVLPTMRRCTCRSG